MAPTVADHGADDPPSGDLYGGAVHHRGTAAVHRGDAFEQNAQAATGGANGEWQTIAQLIYRVGWKNLDLGYAAAMSWALFLIIVVVAAINALLTNRLGGGRT